MKPGHILTKYPELYSLAIEKAKDKNWVLTAGENYSKDIKYLFTHASPETDFLDLAKKLHLCDKKEIKSYNAIVTNLIKNLGPKDEILMPMESSRLLSPCRFDDVALVISYCYESDIRHSAVVRAFERLTNLNPMPKIFFAELILPGNDYDSYLVSKIENVGGKYILINGNEQHRYIFHKEDINNYVVKNIIKDIDYLIFLDSDSYPLKSDWIIDVKEKLIERGDDYIIQPWDEFTDTMDKSLKGLSMSKRAIDGETVWKTQSNPGLCVAMTKNCFDSIRGFPTSCPCGAGDSMLMMEISDGQYEKSYMKSFPYFKEAMRSLPPKNIDYIDCNMIHVWHGDKIDRGYKTRHDMLQSFWPFNDDLYIDENGLLSVKIDSPIQICLANRKSIMNLQDLKSIKYDAINNIKKENISNKVNKIAVCVNSYDNKKYLSYLKECINSIENQSDCIEELYLIIDGNTPRPDFLSDSWKFINTHSGGSSEGRNKIAKTTNCEWIVFVDGDDIMPNGWLANCYNKIQNASSNVGFMYGDISFIGRKKIMTFLSDWDSKLFDGSPHIHSSCIWKTEAIRRCGWPYEVYDYRDDKQFVSRLIQSKYIGENHHGPAFFHRIHDDNISSKRPKKVSEEIERNICIVSCCWGKNDKRTEATRRAIQMWENQTIKPHIIFVEAIDETQEQSLYKDFLPKDRTDHVIIKYNYFNQRGLMQKEALLNIGAKRALNYNVIVFLDCDVWSREPEWLERLSKMFIDDNRNILVQGHRHMIDNGQDSRNWFSFATKYEFDLPDKEYRQPGLCWAMRSSLFKEIGGLNDKCISGSGDVMLLDELAPGEYDKFTHLNLNFYKNAVRRDLIRPILKFVDAYVIHEHHGVFEDRAYWQSREVIDWTSKNVENMVKHDDNGMLIWINPNNKLADVLTDKPKINKIGLKAACLSVGFLKHTYKDVFGWFDFEDIYNKFVIEAPINSDIVEIGCFMGKSTCYLAVEANNSGKNLNITACDIFPILQKDHQAFTTYKCSYPESGTTYEECIKNVKNTGANVNLIKGDGILLSNNFEDNSVFAMFFDADHTYSGTRQFLNSWFKKIMIGGYIGGHDYRNKNYPAIKFAVDEFVKENNLELNFSNISFFIRKK